MAVSTDERREVAARLRELIKQYGMPNGERFYELLDRTLDDPSGYHSYVSVTLYLAELIEPLPERTCKPIDPFDKETKHIVERGLSHYYWPYKGCPECQCDFPQGSNYCPNCGAKVVD